MKVHTDLSDLPDFQNTVITIGSFDGVHTGHQQILTRLRELAKQVNGESVVITFHPHPRLVLRPEDDSLRLLNTIEEKIRLLDQSGIDHLVVVPFTKEFGDQSPDAYIEQFLINNFNPACIVIGYDHRFGKNREGDINYLRRYQEKAGFEIIQIEKHEVEDIGVSSTKIRKALAEGDVGQAAQLLNYFYPMTGKVIKGQQIGSTLGFPTANLQVPEPYKLIPANGIYAVQANYNGNSLRGMMYIGHRPSLEGLDQFMLEVNLFDFAQDIYGADLTIEFVSFIRGDRKFNNLEDLSGQMAIDKLAALKVFEELDVKGNPTSKPSVSVIILNYNGKEQLAEFLPSVIQSDYPDLRIVVADNGSTDGSLEFLEKNFPQVERLDLQRNYGFAQGYNLALQKETADYSILLNSDVKVQANWIRPLIEMMEQDKTIGACQPKILAQRRPHEFEYAGAAGGMIDKLGYPFCRGRVFNVVEADEGQYDDAKEIFWATGAALCVRTELFHDLEGFDGEYFAHSEEIDLCWRMKRAGYKIMVEPQSVVYHVGGGTLDYTSPRKAYLNFRNSLFTMLKNEPTSKLLWLIPVRFILDGVAGFRFLTEGKLPHIWSILRAHASFYRQFSRMIRKRKKMNRIIREIKLGGGSRASFGMYPKSIVWQFYLKRKKRYQDLD